jgi:hypothetical protein
MPWDAVLGHRFPVDYIFGSPHSRQPAKTKMTPTFTCWNAACKYFVATAHECGIDIDGVALDGVTVSMSELYDEEYHETRGNQFLPWDSLVPHTTAWITFSALATITLPLQDGAPSEAVRAVFARCGMATRTGSLLMGSLHDAYLDSMEQVQQLGGAWVAANNAARQVQRAYREMRRKRAQFRAVLVVPRIAYILRDMLDRDP